MSRPGVWQAQPVNFMLSRSEPTSYISPISIAEKFAHTSCRSHARPCGPTLAVDLGPVSEPAALRGMAAQAAQISAEAAHTSFCKLVG